MNRDDCLRFWDGSKEKSFGAYSYSRVLAGDFYDPEILDFFRKEFEKLNFLLIDNDSSFHKERTGMSSLLNFEFHADSYLDCSFAHGNGGGVILLSCLKINDLRVDHRIRLDYFERGYVCFSD